MPLHQGVTIYLRQLYCPLKAHRVRGRNTEDREIGKGVEAAESQGKRHGIMKFVHDGKHVIFNLVKGGRRKKEISEKIQVVVAIVGQGFGIKKIM